MKGALKAGQESWIFRVRQGNQIEILRDKGSHDLPSFADVDTSVLTAQIQMADKQFPFREVTPSACWQL